ELGGLEVVEAGEVRTRELEPRWLLTERTVTVRGFRTGAHTIEPFVVRLLSSAEDVAAETLRTPKARLEIYSVLTKGSTLEDLRGDAGPFELAAEPVRRGLAAAVGLAAAAALLASALLLRRTARRREERRRFPPPPPAHEVALAELARVRDSGLLEEGRLAEYTDRVSDVLRRYLEARFALPAPERTTEEFLDEIAREPVLDRERKRFLAGYLAQCDLVKFAAREPGRREIEELFDSSV
ncbi:unnamed protein product, partial [marine sediment metagenome]